MKHSTFRRAAAVVVAVPACALLAAGPAVAASDVVVTNTETIQAHLDATGKVKDARVYDQLAFTGTGSVEVANPVSTKGLRNLDGFGGYDVKDGKLVTKVSVDGDKRLRTVSDFDKPIPLRVSVTYLLDGKQVAPGKVVGASGRLEVRYHVENTTATTQQVRFDDGTGQQVTKDAQVVIPMVGSLTTVLPPSFTDVASQQANMAGDGRGGTKMSFTMTLFGPIGAATADFGYTATVKDGEVPPASISALPVSPLDSPSFKGGAESYKGGADTGIELTAGATQIDTNLLKLRDGAGQLLAGLIQLRDGAQQLNSGLAGEAAPGAAKLSAGASDAAKGADQLNDGLYTINAGAKQLAAGANDAKDGAAKLADGSRQVADGLHEAGAKAPELIGGLGQVRDGLVAVDAGLATMSSSIGGLSGKAQPLRDGISQLMAGIGSTSVPGDTLLYGLASVRDGLSTKALPGINELKDQLQCATVILADVKAGATPLAPGAHPCYPDGRPAMAAADPGASAALTGLLQKVGASGDMTDATALGGLNLLAAGLDLHPAGTYGPADPGGAGWALARIQCGVDNTSIGGVCDPAKPGVKQGIALVGGGVDQLIGEVTSQVQAGVGTPSSGPTTLRGGVAALQDGISKLSEGGNALLEGLTVLGAGADQVATGNKDLLAGLRQLSTGAGRLAGGTADAKSGAGRLADGNRQIATGASDLASGLHDAAVGSGRLADGLGTAAESAPQLEDGAQRLSDEGTSKLVDAGKSTAADYGEKYALIVAGAERAKNEGMAYGAPDGASGVTAYSLELAGESGEGSRNLGRGLGAIAVLGLGTGAAALVRRRAV